VIWRIEWDDRARKELRKLGKQIQEDILRYLRERIATKEDPKRFGKSLSFEKHGLWRYRVHNYRIICSIEEDESIVLVLGVGHRKDIYD
jgi:mRNA interferase RelE/StbE